MEEAILYIEELQRQLKDRLEETLEEEERKHWEEMEEVVEKEESFCFRTIFKSYHVD